ncbi:hypothetical protein [Vibrio metoecus]
MSQTLNRDQLNLIVLSFGCFTAFGVERVLS